LEHGLKKRGLLTFIRELDGNDNESIDNYLRDASMYARGRPAPQSVPD
jgi:atrial natriuretic peptide receptor A